MVIALAIIVVLNFKKNRLMFFSAGYFVSAVALVLMIFPVGPTLFSERYSYVPSVMLYFFGFSMLWKYVPQQAGKIGRAHV